MARDNKQLLILAVTVMAAPVIASMITGFLGVDVIEAFECWCREEKHHGKGKHGAKGPAAPLLTPLIGPPLALVKTNIAVLPLPDFGPAPIKYTLAFWINIPGVSNQYRGIMRFGNDDGQRKPALWVAPGGTTIHYRHGNSADNNDGFPNNVGSMPGNVWAHFAMVVDGRTATPYFNGVAQAPYTFKADPQVPAVGSSLYFCQDPAAYLDGSKPLQVAYVGFTSKALTPEQIKAVYAAPHPGF